MATKSPSTPSSLWSRHERAEYSQSRYPDGHAEAGRGHVARGHDRRRRDAPSCRPTDRVCSQCGRHDPTGAQASSAPGDDLLTAATLVGDDDDANLESATFLTPVPPADGDPLTVLKAMAAKSTAPSRRRDKTLQTKPQLDQTLVPRALFGRRYRIQRFLGAGAMGYVCDAVDESIDEVVALKILSVPIHDEPEAFERFKLELKLARKIRHRNVVQSFDLGFADGFPFISMEYIDADNLLKHLSRQETYAEPAALAILRQVVRGVAPGPHPAT